MIKRIWTETVYVDEERYISCIIIIIIWYFSHLAVTVKYNFQ